jgi:hypothetical protein
VSICPDCGRHWTGLSEAHCPNPSCCQHFTSDAAFDRHLAPTQSDDACYPPETSRKKDGSPVFEQIQRKHGPAWRLARADSNPFATSDQYQDRVTGGLDSRATP